MQILGELQTIGANNQLSNCIQFINAEISPDGLSLISYGLPKAFTLFEENQWSKENRVELSVGSYAAGNVSVWFILEYSAVLINKIHELNSGLNAEYITYANDIMLGIKIV